MTLPPLVRTYILTLGYELCRRFFDPDELFRPFLILMSFVDVVTHFSI